MKMRMISYMLAIVTAFVLTGCGRGSVRAAERGMESVGNAVESMGQSVMQSVDPAQTATGNRITREQAENLALEHAGLTADQVTGLRAEFDTDHGYPEYDVEFRYQTREFDYEIDAETGEILSYSVDD